VEFVLIAILHAPVALVLETPIVKLVMKATYWIILLVHQDV